MSGWRKGQRLLGTNSIRVRLLLAVGGGDWMLLLVVRHWKEEDVP